MRNHTSFKELAAEVSTELAGNRQMGMRNRESVCCLTRHNKIIDQIVRLWRWSSGEHGVWDADVIPHQRRQRAVAYVFVQVHSLASITSCVDRSQQRKQLVTASNVRLRRRPERLEKYSNKSSSWS